MKKKEIAEEEKSNPLAEIAKQFDLWIPGEQKESLPKFYFSTGSTLLDLAIGGPGLGVPSGLITEISGVESSAKTVLGAIIAGNCQKQGGLVVIYDVESTFDYQRGRAYGVNPSKILVPPVQPGTIEDLFEQIRQILAKTNEKCYCFLIDSLAALETISESKEEYNVVGYGTQRAKMFSKVFRSLPRLLTEKNASLILINQIRETVGRTFGNVYDTPGGKAIKFYSSCRISLSVKNKIKDAKDRIVGIEIKASVIKNKIGRPFLTAEFPIYFNELVLDNLESCTRFLRTNSNELGEKKASYSFKNISKKGMNAFLDSIEEANLGDELVDLTKKVWNDFNNLPIRR